MDPLTWSLIALALATCGASNNYYPGGKDDKDAGASDVVADVGRDSAVKPRPDAAGDALRPDGDFRPSDMMGPFDGPALDESRLADAAPSDVGADAYVTVPPQWGNFTCTVSYSTDPEVRYGMRMVSTASSSSERNRFIGVARFAASTGTDIDAERARQNLPANEWECDACTIPDYAENLTGVYYIVGSFESPDAGTIANVSIANYTLGGDVSSAAIFPMTPCVDSECTEIDPIDPAYTNEIYPAYDHPVEVPVVCTSAGEECAGFEGETTLAGGETFGLECRAE